MESSGAEVGAASAAVWVRSARTMMVSGGEVWASAAYPGMNIDPRIVDESNKRAWRDFINAISRILLFLMFMKIGFFCPRAVQLLPALARSAGRQEELSIEIAWRSEPTRLRC